MAERTIIFINPRTAGLYQQEEAQRLLKRIPDSTTRDLKFPLGAISEEVQTTIVFGGDGSVNGVTKALLRRDNPGLLIVAKAGSQAGFYRALRDAGSTVNVDQLESGETGNARSFRPGSLDGIIFNHAVDLTQTGLLQARFNEMMRPTVHRKLRAYIAAFQAFLATSDGINSSPFKFEMLLTGPRLGKIMIAPRQQLFDDRLTLVSLHADNKVEGAFKMATWMFMLATNQDLPSGMVDYCCKSSILLPGLNGKVNTDGEVEAIEPNVSLEATRHQKAFPAVALVRNRLYP